MTKSEAIQCIKHELLITVNRKDLTGQAIGEALDMAIDALSEPSGDLISRADAIRWVKTECNQYGKPTLEFESGKRVIEHLKQMPSAVCDDCIWTVCNYNKVDWDTPSAEAETKTDDENELKFYYVESIDDYWVGRRLDNFYYANWHKGLGFIWSHSRYLPWGEHIVDENTLWKEHTYPSEPIEIPFTEWVVGFVKKYFTEPKTGEWVWSDEDASWMCGACCCVFEEIDWKPNYNFCPNCGAKMCKGGDEE